jgi:8-amino-7-oxononanoate synthase
VGLLKQSELGSSGQHAGDIKTRVMSWSSDRDTQSVEPVNPFGQYFESSDPYSLDNKLFSARQQAKMAQIRATYESGGYTFHQALDYKSGPNVEIAGRGYKMLSSYDYLGLIGHPQIEQAAITAIRQFGTGSGGVRLLTGTNKLHLNLEEYFAEFKGTEAAATFSSGYNANLSVISLLMDTKDMVLVDNKIHQSTIDGCKLSGVPFRRFEHNDADALEHLLKKYSGTCKVLVISEGMFSMDGDICDLPKLVALKNKYGALLMIDEAHSLGVLGKNGRGVDSHFNIDPREVDIFVGSFSKGVPANGGFIAGSKELVILMQHASTPYIFSAAQNPATVASIFTAIQVMQSEPERFEKLWANYHYFISGLKQLGYCTGITQSPIIPVILGREEAALQFSRKLFDNGILATSVIFPAVPKNEARLRLCVTAAQDKCFLEQCLDVFDRLKLLAE